MCGLKISLPASVHRYPSAVHQQYAVNLLSATSLINSFGNLSGFFGPAMMGWVNQLTGSYQGGLWTCVVVPLIGAASMALLARSLGKAR